MPKLPNEGYDDWTPVALALTAGYSPMAIWPHCMVLVVGVQSEDQFTFYGPAKFFSPFVFAKMVQKM